MNDPLRQWLAELLDLPADQLGEDDNLLDHGLDSIRMMSLVEDFRAAGSEISFADLAEEPTLQRWRAVLAEP